MINTILKIDFLSVLEKLWLEHNKCWANEYRINKSDGRTLNTESNLVCDFSQNRADWNQFSFVKNYLKLDNKETLDWFRQKFGIDEKDDYNLNQKEKKMEKKTYNIETLKKIWQQLPLLEEKQKEYLLNRWIEYNKIKDIVKLYKWWIACCIYDENWAIGLNTRLIQWEQRFIALAWYSTNWVYLHKIDKNIKYIIVVEWLIDFLTLRQYNSNIIWLKNWSNWIELIKKLSKNYEIIVIPDNDESWKKTIEKIENEFDYKLVDIWQYWYKDINEMVVNEIIGEEIIDLIFNIIVDKTAWSIDNAIEQMKWYQLQRQFNSSGKLWFDWPHWELDKFTEWIIPWKVYTIGSWSNVWKSKFSYWYVNYFLEKWKKVYFFSLEVDAWMVLMNLISSKYKLDLREATNKSCKEEYKNLKIFDNVFEMEKIKEIVENQKPDIVFIDFVQNINWKWMNMYEKMSWIAKDIQQMAIKSKSVVFSLSQLANNINKDISQWNLDFVSLKGAWEFYASSDVIFILRKLSDNKSMQLKIVKNKYWPNGIIFEVQADLKYWRFSVLPSEDFNFF